MAKLTKKCRKILHGNRAISTVSVFILVFFCGILSMYYIMGVEVLSRFGDFYE